MNGLAVWAAYVLISRSHWIALVVLALATLAIDLVYLGPRSSVPLKFLIPGTVFPLAFQVIPIIYTVEVAFTNYSTGHVVTKADAVKQIELTSLQPPAERKDLHDGRREGRGGHVVLILQDDASRKVFVGTPKGLDAAPARHRQGGCRRHRVGKGLHAATRARRSSTSDKFLQTYVVPVGTAGIRPQTTSTAVELEPTLRYDARARHVRAASPTTRSSGTCKASTCTLERRARARLEDRRRHQEFLAHHPRPARAPAVHSGVHLDIRVRGSDRPALVRARAVPRDHARQERAALPAHVPVDPRHPVRDPGLPLAARLAGVAERPVRRREQDLPPGHPVALRRELGRRSRASLSAPG